MAFGSRIGLLCFGVLAVGGFLIFAGQLQAQAKENGKICVTNGDCTSGRCSWGADLTNKYCASSKMDCARENHDGANFGDILKNKDGLRVKCVQGRGWASVASLIQNGHICSDPKTCSSGYCAIGPGVTAKYCLAKEMNCASRNSPGFRYKDEVITPSGRYRCTQAASGAYWQSVVDTPPPPPPPPATVQAVINLICVSNLGKSRVPYFGRGQTCSQAFQDAHAQADRFGCRNNLYTVQDRIEGSTPDCR